MLLREARARERNISRLAFSQRPEQAQAERRAVQELQKANAGRVEQARARISRSILEQEQDSKQRRLNWKMRRQARDSNDLRISLEREDQAD